MFNILLDVTEMFDRPSVSKVGYWLPQTQWLVFGYTHFA